MIANVKFYFNQNYYNSKIEINGHSFEKGISIRLDKDRFAEVCTAWNGMARILHGHRRKYIWNPSAR